MHEKNKERVMQEAQAGDDGHTPIKEPGSWGD